MTVFQKYLLEYFDKGSFIESTKLSVPSIEYVKNICHTDIFLNLTEDHSQNTTLK